MLLRFFQEIREAGIEMIKKSKILSKTILLSMKKEKKKTLIPKSTILWTPPHFLI
jgi:hypothetical protein